MRKRHDNFGLPVDLSHFPTTYETTQFAIQTMKEYITHLHIGNAVVQPGCEAYGDQHPRFGYPNSANDTPQLVEFFKVLRQEGFFNPQTPYVLSFEVKPWKDEDGDVILANTKRVINRAWALLTDDAVAQYVFALLLEICHHVGHHSQAVHAGRWTTCRDFCFWDYPLIELAGKTMGMVGFGRIGQAAAAIAKGFGQKANPQCTLLHS